MGGKHGHGHEHGHDHLGNPADMAAYLEKLEGADRDAWQQPDAVIAALRLREGAKVAEIGPGPGYFTLRLSRALGAAGRVFAIEAEPKMVHVLRARLHDAGVHNVEVVIAEHGDALPPEPVDCVLVVNTFHHFPRGVEYLRALAGRLAPGGILANIDFHAMDTPVGPPAEHRISREAFLDAAKDAGLALVREERFLPYQYFVVLAKR